MSTPTLDRTWTEDAPGVHLEAHVKDFSVDAVRGDFQETVQVRGELDIATAPLLSAVLDTVLARRPWRVEVDLSAVTFLDAYSVSCLDAARHRLAAHRAVLVVRGPSPVARRVLGLTGFDRVVEIAEGTRAEAD